MHLGQSKLDRLWQFRQFDSFLIFNIQNFFEECATKIIISTGDRPISKFREG